MYNYLKRILSPQNTVACVAEISGQISVFNKKWFFCTNIRWTMQVFAILAIMQQKPLKENFYTYNIYKYSSIVGSRVTQKAIVFDTARAYSLLTFFKLWPSLRMSAVSWVRLQTYKLTYTNSQTRNNYNSSLTRSSGSSTWNPNYSQRRSYHLAEGGALFLYMTCT